MTEISKHIEILLLDNDCVIVPDFGAFMSHYVSAQFIEDEELFCPPKRTIGFNPQVQLNDSLLAQSYVEAYDISYPEAVQRIMSEVEEIKQVLDIEGEYIFHGIGTLKLTSDRRYDFIPTAAGLLTPSLYALNSFEVSTIERSVMVSEPTVVMNDVDVKSLPLLDGSVMRSLAIAAMILFLFVLSSIPVGNGGSDIEQCSVVNPQIISKFVEENAEGMGLSLQSDTLYNKDTTVVAEQAVRQEAVKPLVRIQHEETHYYVLVVAARVSRSGAKDLVSRLKKCGFTDTNISEKTSNRKVIYGHYKSENEALNALRSLRNQDISFTDAWISRV